MELIETYTLCTDRILSRLTHIKTTRVATFEMLVGPEKRSARTYLISVCIKNKSIFLLVAPLENIFMLRL